MMMADLKQFLRMMMSSQALALVVHISGSRVEFHWGNISCLVFISLVLFKLALINDQFKTMYSPHQMHPI
jgi:hypothetical protein